MKSTFLGALLLGLLLGNQASAQGPPSASAPAMIHGIVKSGNMPIPGASVSLSRDDSSSKISVWTDVDGSYSVTVPSSGSWTVRVEMSAFAVASRTVLIDASHGNAQADFELTLLSRSRPNEGETRRAGMTPGGSRGFQRLLVAPSLSQESN